MSRTLKAIFNEANPNKIANASKELPLGEALKTSPKYYRGAVVSNVLVLPEDARAVQILRANSLAGTLTGNMAPQAPGATPTTGQSAVNATGNVAFASADAVTSAEVWYVPLEGDIVEEVVAVVSDVATLSQGRAAVLLLAYTSLAGTPLGAFTVVNRGATPSTTQAALSALGTTVVGASADTVTQARIRYVVAPGVGTGTRPSLLTRLLTDLFGW